MSNVIIRLIQAKNEVHGDEPVEVYKTSRYRKASQARSRSSEQRGANYRLAGNLLRALFLLRAEDQMV